MIILVLPSPADDNNTMLVKTRTADYRINQKLLTGRISINGGVYKH